MVAIYDLYHLDQIEDDVLGRCNEHWVAEFKERCTAYSVTDPEFTFGELNFSLDSTGEVD